MKVIASGLAILAVIGLIGYGIYQMKRSWNYSMGYESKVQESALEVMCENIKPEYLIDPKVC